MVPNGKQTHRQNKAPSVHTTAFPSSFLLRAEQETTWAPGARAARGHLSFPTGSSQAPTCWVGCPGLAGAAKEGLLEPGSETTTNSPRLDCLAAEGRSVGYSGCLHCSRHLPCIKASALCQGLFGVWGDFPRTRLGIGALCTSLMSASSQQSSPLLERSRTCRNHLSPPSSVLTAGSSMFPSLYLMNKGFCFQRGGLRSQQCGPPVPLGKRTGTNCFWARRTGRRQPQGNATPALGGLNFPDFSD